MPILPASAYETKLPVFHRVRQLFPDDHIDDLERTVNSQLQSPEIANAIPYGATVAILVGSRGIVMQKEIVKLLVDHLKASGTKPFLVPAMGSHGNGDGDQQRKIVEDYGMTEDYLGIPIRSSVETKVIGYTPTHNLPVHVDVNAAAADFIIPINRIKKHTDFDADIESGVCKMLTIGLGKHNGCTVYHRKGLSHFGTILPEVTSMVMAQFRIPFGIGIVENAHEHLHTVKVMRGNALIQEEKELLTLSKSLMPYLRFDHLDVLVVQAMGKDLCGAGLDPSITGRTTYGSSAFYRGPSIHRIVVNDLSDGSHGNAIGMGFADFITKKLFDKIDFEPTYANVVACTNLSTGMIPLVMKDEEEALLTAMHSMQNVDVNHLKIARIPNTLQITEIEVSESLLPYCTSHSQFFEILD